MKELVIQPQQMSSREIAELYEKPHNDTLKKIRVLEDAYVQVYGTEGKISLSAIYCCCSTQNVVSTKYMLTSKFLCDRLKRKPWRLLYETE